jgi:predicted O-methyltransferase YrrM
MLKELLRPIYVPVANYFHQTFRAPKRYHHLFDEIKKHKATTLVEVGTWNGDRAVQMIQEAQKSSPGTVVHYVGFDLFEDLTQEMYQHELSKKPPTKHEVEKKLHTTGAKIELIKGNTLETLPLFASGTTKADFVFIDGGHNVETIASDWRAVQRIMHKDTVVIFDDYWRNNSQQSAKPVVDAIDTTQYRVEILPEIDRFTNPDFGKLEISFAKVTLKSTAG